MTEVDKYIADVEAFYKLIIAGSHSRLVGGNKLWDQFESAVLDYRKRGMASFKQVIERVNELVVAKIILGDPTLLDAKIEYEPHIGTDSRRIDFVTCKANGENLFIEVKTVRPNTKDCQESWGKFKKRRELHTYGTHYIAMPEWNGGKIAGDSFSARSKFMEYTRAFETKLAEARESQPGRGALIFCGTGMEWHRSELDDFVDFYRTGHHRRDDPFANMEAGEINDKGISLMRNIDSFGFMKRPQDQLTEEAWDADGATLIKP